MNGEQTVDEMLDALVGVVIQLPCDQREGFLNEVFKNWRVDNPIGMTVVKELEDRLVRRGVIEIIPFKK